jgi:hypothetical protein
MIVPIYAKILDKDEKDIIENLNSDDIEFLQNMPLFMQFGKIIKP